MYFKASRGSDKLFKMIILSKTIERCHKVSFQTICIDVCSFLGFPEAKVWSKWSQIKTENCKKKLFLKAKRVFFLFI